MQDLNDASVHPAPRDAALATASTALQRSCGSSSDQLFSLRGVADNKIVRMPTHHDVASFPTSASLPNVKLPESAQPSVKVVYAMDHLTTKLRIPFAFIHPTLALAHGLPPQEPVPVSLSTPPYSLHGTEIHLPPAALTAAPPVAPLSSSFIDNETPANYASNFQDAQPPPEPCPLTPTICPTAGHQRQRTPHQPSGLLCAASIDDILTSAVKVLHDSAALPAPASICRLFLERRCKQRDRCHQVHVDVTYLRCLRNEITRLGECCRKCDDTAPHYNNVSCGAVDPSTAWKEALLIVLQFCGSLRIALPASRHPSSSTSPTTRTAPTTVKAELRNGAEESHSSSIVASSALGSTAHISWESLSPSVGLRVLVLDLLAAAGSDPHDKNTQPSRAAAVAAMRVDVPLDVLCRGHFRGPFCKFGDTCKFVHVCRRVHAAFANPQSATCDERSATAVLRREQVPCAPRSHGDFHSHMPLTSDNPVSAPSTSTAQAMPRPLASQAFPYQVLPNPTPPQQNVVAKTWRNFPYHLQNRRGPRTAPLDETDETQV